MRTKSDAQALADALLAALDIERIAPPEDPAGVSERSGSLTLGGSGRVAGDGGGVTIVQSGTVATTGFGAVGILAQSIGGGGGLASVAAGPGGHRYTFGIGGAGGASGSGGPVGVSLTAGAQVSTVGDAAPRCCCCSRSAAAVATAARTRRWDTRCPTHCATGPAATVGRSG